MSRPLIGARLARTEDPRLLVGAGQYVSDVRLPGMLHLALVRSPYAHAQVDAISAEAARNLPGVVGIFSGDDLPEALVPFPVGMADPRIRAAMPSALADRVVRYVGEPVAVVVAASRYQAEDGADAVMVDYTPLPTVTHARQGEAPPAILHEGWDSNLAGVLEYRSGDGRAALNRARHVVSLELTLARVIAHPLEPRGIVAAYDAELGTLKVWAGTQGVHGLRNGLARVLGLEPEHVTVVAPDVGGGFGVKNRLYPEDMLACLLSMRLGRPVKWTGDRREEALSTNQERDQVHQAQIGFDAEGRIVAVVDDFWQDNGAYTSAGNIVLNTTAVCIPGPYRVPHFEARGHLVLTNKVPMGPYRGAGRPQATHVMERLMDRAADELGWDRVELRRKNLVRLDEMPYRTGVVTGAGPVTYDGGDFPLMMETALAALKKPPERSASSAASLWGVGVANYVEVSAGVGFEGARFTLLPDGRVEVATGAASQGQGHRTALAQIAADRLSLPMDQIVVVEGDTAAIERGIGTFGSRTMVMAGNAVGEGAPRFRDLLLERVREALEAHRDDLTWDNGVVGVIGVPERRMTLRDVAGYIQRAQEPLPQLEYYYDRGASTYGGGTHAALVEVDPETLRYTLRDYVICHDAGVVVNPLLADGQTIGGTVQGLGMAMTEALAFDAQGQPQNQTLLDYLLPEAPQMPDFRIVNDAGHWPSTSNPEGFKGVAEGGTMPATAVLASALENALQGRARIDAIPVRSSTLFEVITAKNP